MSISSGTRLGPYEVLSLLGAGGMGEVYRARDTRLSREVAIKVLPAQFANDADRLRRFEQEARATSALNHPNILTIFDIGNYGGAPYIVAELLQGGELRETMNAGALPVQKALEYAGQIAAGLAAAHEKGIVHRDLKPANLFVTTDDRIKILDFGLAKLRPQWSESRSLSVLKTEDAGTNPGVVMGTAGYMSPEQVRGQEADSRSDIFSFGVILYEMLVGRRAFEGETMAETMTAILKEEPPELADMGLTIHPALERVVRRCLEKKRERRFQTASDLGFALEGISTIPGSLAKAAATALPDGKAGEADKRRKIPGRTAWVVAAFTLLGGLLTDAILRLTAPPPAVLQVKRLSVVLPRTDHLEVSHNGSSIAISPDGQTIVYTATRNGVTQLFRRSLDQLEPMVLAGTEGAHNPFFSPDGAWVGFGSAGKLKKTLLSSKGNPVDICDAPGFSGGAWASDNGIVFSESGGKGLQRVRASGGAPEKITSLGPADMGHGLPQFLPGEAALLFFLDRGEDFIAIHSFRDGKTRDLLAGDAAGYSPTGHLVFKRKESLWAAPFDLQGLRLTGEPVRVLEGLRSEPQGGIADYGFGRDGTLVYLTGSNPRNRPVWLDRQGKRESLGDESRSYQNIALSPDGSRLAFTVRGENNLPGGVWIHDLGRQTWVPLNTGSSEFAPVWSPDGARIAFARWEGNRSNLFVKDVDATRPEERLLDRLSGKFPQFWTPDGKGLVFMETRAWDGNFDLHLLSLEGGRQDRPLLNTSFAEMNAALSPDGRFMAYQSNETGQPEIYVRPFPGVDAARWPISSDGGDQPRWSPNGKELFYFKQHQLMVVPVETAPKFSAGKAQMLLETRTPVVPMLGVLPYAIAPDGRRFLLLEEEASADQEKNASQIIVVVNWLEELRRMVAPSK